jgi:transcriptional regulator with XRE-family HTH domain
MVSHLVEARKAAGLTQQQVADRLKKPQSFVAKVEAGERRLDLIEFLQFTRALGADPARIVRAVRVSMIAN